MGVLILGIGTKWHLGVGPVANQRKYYKGECGGFPQVWALVILVSLCLHMVHLRTNQLVVWFVEVCVSSWFACQSS
jgi:phosphatidylserine synthase